MGQPTWADRVRKGATEQVTRGSPPEHSKESERLAQLERENRIMRDTIASLMAEIAEIKKVGGKQPAAEDKQTPQPADTPMAEECETERPAKKRAIVREQDTPSGRAKSEIREMLSSLSESMKQLSETVSHIQGSMLSMEERYNQRFCKIEAFLENVVAPTVGQRALSLPSTASVGQNVRGPHRTNSATQLQQQPHDGCAN